MKERSEKFWLLDDECVGLCTFGINEEDIAPIYFSLICAMQVNVNVNLVLTSRSPFRRHARLEHHQTSSLKSPPSP